MSGLSFGGRVPGSGAASGAVSVSGSGQGVSGSGSAAEVSRLGLLFDAFLAGTILFLSARMDSDFLYAPIVTMPDQVTPPSWMRGVLIVWAIVSWAVISVRRRFPGFANVALPTLLLAHLLLLPTGYASFVVTAFAVYHLGRCVPRRWFVPVWAALAAGVFVALVFRAEYLFIDVQIGLVFTPVALAVLGFFWMVGFSGRRRDQELMALRDRAELAAIAERTRIAREMHDIVAHSLTAVIAQADGGRYIAAKHPDKAVEALENIAGTARASLGQMRQLLSVLRDPGDLDGASTQAPAPGTSATSRAEAGGTPVASQSSPISSPTVSAAPEFAPMPGLDALPQLVAEATRSGLRVSFTEEGRRPEVGATMQLTIYRIIQESLTNALKHAGPVAVEVRLGWGKRGGLVTVRNEAGTGAMAQEASESGERVRVGRGITGMRERVALHGGTLEIDETPDGFTVTARLPKE